jgi:hypothetical protein
MGEPCDNGIIDGKSRDCRFKNLDISKRPGKVIDLIKVNSHLSKVRLIGE